MSTWRLQVHWNPGGSIPGLRRTSPYPANTVDDDDDAVVLQLVLIESTRMATSLQQAGETSKTVLRFQPPTEIRTTDIFS